MFPEVIAIILGAFGLGIMFKGYWAKKEEARWKKQVQEAQDDRHHFIYRWNVATCRLGVVRRLVEKALGSNGESPYRGDHGKLLEVLRQVYLKTDEGLKDTCREVGCFHSLEEAGEYVTELDSHARDASEPHGDARAYPIIVRHKEWDGTCWHVIYGTDGNREV